MITEHQAFGMILAVVLVMLFGWYFLRSGEDKP